MLLAPASRVGDQPGVGDQRPAGLPRHWSRQPVDDAGQAAGPARLSDDLAAEVRALEAGESPRWVWATTSELYPSLLEAGVRVDRCHDLAMTEVLLSGHEGRPAAPFDSGYGGQHRAASQASLFAVPEPEPDDPLVGPGTDSGPGATDPASRLLAAHADQLTRIEAAKAISPGFGLLVAAESAAALAAAEMGRVGLPWRADIHDRVLTDLLGERPRHGGRPPKLQALALTVAEALGESRRGGAAQLNVDSPLEILRAFRRQGVLLETTRAHELKTIDHPAIEPLLRYKELARLHVAHGWAWRDQWVQDGRFRPEYVPGGVVSGRWATKGGGALQIPKVMREPVVADPGWALVVADAGQLEPRILAALSRDPGMVAATKDTDLYAALAAQALGSAQARDETKIALLAAMYGARANSPAMAALRRRFPQALDLLEAAARTGEDGGIVRSALGRTCPAPDPNWQQGAEAAMLARSRARGRFTRNFVIQASAADWANVLVAGLRRRLNALSTGVGAENGDGDEDGTSDGPGPNIVLFQHDEVVVHTPQALVQEVITAIAESGDEATRLVVGDRGVHIPLTGVSVSSYADKH